MRRERVAIVLPVALALTIVTMIVSTGTAGTLVGPVTFTDDATAEISSLKTYTHLIDLGSDSKAAVVNGVAFDNVNTTGANATLGFTLSAATFTSGFEANTGVPSDSGMHTLLSDFGYTDPYSITLSSASSGAELVEGETYELRLYYRPYSTTSDGPRLVEITFDEDGAGVLGSSIVLDEDEDNYLYDEADRIVEARYIAYRYTATSSPLVVTFNRQDTRSWHLYGLSNELVTVPEPSICSMLIAGLLGLVVLRRPGRTSSSRP